MLNRDGGRVTQLYHADVFIPPALLSRAKAVQFNLLVWSRHAQHELVNDRYGMLSAYDVPLSFDAPGWELIELEADGEKIAKYVFRRPVDSWRSLVIVFRPTGAGVATVTTCWTNRTADKHKTLDRSKYATA